MREVGSIDGAPRPMPVVRTPRVAGPLDPTAGAIARVHPLGLDEVALERGGALGDWQHRNRVATIPHCVEQVVRSGAMGNLDRVARDRAGEAEHVGMVFSDSDVYKVLESIAWESVRTIPDELDDFARRAVRTLARAQRVDGYLNSWFQGGHAELAWTDLRWGHELYCAGHLLQASTAAVRTGSIPGLSEVADKLLDHVLATFSSAEGDGGLVAICGHPLIETALVEHFRATGDERALRLAARQIDMRGRTDVGLPTSSVIDGRPFALSYFLHHAPVRLRRTATGHAVRELYLQAGVVDVAAETRDDELLAASEAIWEDLYGTKTYLTGSHGSRHRDESIGDAYELPGDRAYAETCAAIASFHWNWRLLLATGRARYAAAMEKVLWNTIAGAVSRHGTAFFYSNTLHLRTNHEVDDEDAPSHRRDWYSCACCPPNLARLVASVQGYLVTRDEVGLQVQLPFAGTVSTALAGGRVELEVRTDHPWGGETAVSVCRTTASDPWSLAFRVPEWTTAHGTTVLLNGHPVDAPAGDGYLSVTRRWSDGDTVTVATPVPIRVVRAHPRVDAVRGAVAIQRGPLVYCVEGDDLGAGVDVEDVELDAHPQCTATSDVPAGLDGQVKVAIRVRGARIASRDLPLYGSELADEPAVEPLELAFVPYFARAHRAIATMRVWVPTRSHGLHADPGTRAAPGHGAPGGADHHEESEQSKAPGREC